MHSLIYISVESSSIEQVETGISSNSVMCVQEKGGVGGGGCWKHLRLSVMVVVVSIMANG